MIRKKELLETKKKQAAAERGETVHALVFQKSDRFLLEQQFMDQPEVGSFMIDMAPMKLAAAKKAEQEHEDLE